MPILNGRTTLTTILIGSIIPAGSVTSFAGNAAPAGWLLCDGSTVSRTTYADLFAAIGETYGAGDGVTTFVLPDTRGRTSVGKDNMGGTAANRMTTAASGVDGTTLGASGGAQTHTLTNAQLSSHDHAATSGNNTHRHRVLNTSGGGVQSLTSGYGFMGNDGTNANNYITNNIQAVPYLENNTHNHTVTVNTNGSGSAHQNTQPSIIFNHIIKY